ncbi:MAG: AAA family ATPase [Flavobacteriales bacterium]
MASEAINKLREALKFSPDNIPLKLHIGEMLLEEREYPEAISEFNGVLAKYPSHEAAKLLLAKTFLLQGNYSATIVIAEEEQFKNNPEALLLLAKAHFKDKSISEAIDVYKRVLKLDPRMTDSELDSLRTQSAAAENAESDDDEFDEDATYRIVENPGIDFNDVGGMEKVKREIDLKIIQPLKNPEIYKAYGKKIGGGILLYGPPGCGKTHLARATAGQVKAKFINIGINDVLDMWIGNSEKNLHEIFEYARRNKPCVLFFDEIDALGASRSDMKQSAGRHLINQFLSELDGVDGNNDGILVLGATNAPWHLDPAFRRPGRFDRIIFVSPPDDQSKEVILELQLKDKPKADIDYSSIAKKMNDYSGADINAVIDIAIESKLEESIKTGVPQPLTTKDLLNAVKLHRASTRDWFNSAKNYALYANESGLYDDILSYLNIRK